MNLSKILTKKMSIKNVLIIFSTLLIIFIMFMVSKSYAIYKLQKDFNIIKNQIGTYKSGDYQVAVLVDGKEIDTFPSYETNYKIESVDCTNGVTATFDVENWQLNIADMSSTSCKCTVSFNSKEKNEINPIAMTKKELLAMNSELTNTTYEILKTKLLDDTYPVGSIYMSTTDDTIEKVQTKFGGTWTKYSEGTTLVGANDSYTVNSTGGSSTVTLTNANLPAHNHSIPALSGTAASAGSHTHGLYGANTTTGNSAGNNSYSGNGWIPRLGGTLWNTADAIIASGAHTHSISTTASNTNGCTNCSATAVNIQNPYTAVYMYKRTA